MPQINAHYIPCGVVSWTAADKLSVVLHRYSMDSWLLEAAWLNVTLACTRNAVRKPQLIRRSGWWLVEMETDGWETWWWHCLLSGITKSLMEVRIHTSPYWLPTVLPALSKNANWQVVHDLLWIERMAKLLSTFSSVCFTTRMVIFLFVCPPLIVYWEKCI